MQIEKTVLSIIIPTKNEAGTIRQVIQEILLIKESLPPTEILVVDGGSWDRTDSIAYEAGAQVFVEERAGYGRAILTGFEKAKGQIFLVMDGDGTYPGRAISRLIQPILRGEADLVLGSRTRLLKDAMSSLRIFGNILLTHLFNTLFNSSFSDSISDSQTGMRAISKKATEKLNLDCNGFPLTTQINAQAVKKGLRILEIPIVYRPRKGKSKLSPFLDGIKIIITMIRERMKS